MARSWLSIRVELVSGRGQYWWPRPGRVLVARRTFTFRQLARAIDEAFGRWDRSHLHRFILDSTELLPLEYWDDPPPGAADDTSRLSILELGQQFAYEFDMGDGWEHLCTVGPERVDPWEVLGIEPDRPMVAFGWGDLPDQYGRRFADDDGTSPLPDQPDPPTSDLPPLLPHWGDWTPPTGSEQPDWLAPWQDWDEESWRELLGAVNGRDGAAVVAVLRTHEALEFAQLAGQGLLSALAQQVEGAWVMARRLADGLRHRLVAGDDELADELDAARGVIDSELRPVTVHLDELAMQLEGDQMGAEGWNLDLETGHWWPDNPVAMTGEQPPDWDNPDRWLSVSSIGSRDAWKDMRDYIDRIEDADLAERLHRAIHGRGAFRRFKDELFRHEQLGRAWYRFSDDRKRGRARAWLARQGLRPAGESDQGDDRPDT